MPTSWTDYLSPLKELFVFWVKRMVNRNKCGGNMYNAFSCFMGNDDIDVLVEYFKKYFAQFEVDVGVKPLESANIPDCIQTDNILY